MGTKVEREFLRGLLIHDPRLSLANVDTTNSVATQSGWEPDQPNPTNAGFQDLDGLGSLNADVEALFNLGVTRSGAAVGGNDGGRFRHRVDGESNSSWRGNLSPNKVTGWTHVRFSSPNDYDHPHALTTPEHKVIVVYGDTTNTTVEASVLDPADDTWSSTTVTSDTSGPACITRLPDNTDNGGRLVCFYFRSDFADSGVSFHTIGASYSDDDGATWTELVDHVSGFQVDQASFDIRRIRGVFHGGFITLIAETEVGVVDHAFHLVSTTQGAAFTEVEDITGDDDHFFDLYVVDDKVYIVYIDAGFLLGGSKGTPFGSFQNDPSYNKSLGGETAYGNTDEGTVAAVVFDDALYVISILGLGVSTTDRTNMQLQRFDPRTQDADRDQWTSSSNNSGTGQVPDWPANFGNDDDESVLQLSATPYKGGILLFNNPLSNNVLSDDIACLWLGGYSSIDWSRQTFGSHRNPTPNDNGILWTGAHLPGDVAAWTVSGSAVIARVNGGIQFAVTANQYLASRTGSTNGNPCLVWARVKVNTGGSLIADHCGIRVRRANSTFEYEISVRLAPSAIAVYDVNTGGSPTQIGSTTTGLPTGVFRDILIGLEGTKVSVYYKAPEDTLWTAVVDGGTVGDTGPGAASDRVQWISADLNSTADSTWAMLGSTIDDVAGSSKVEDYTNPADLQGRPFSTTDQWLGTTEGLRIRAKGGAAFKGDSWDVGSRPQNGYANIHHEIEPRKTVGWRTTGTDLTTLQWTPSGGNLTYLGSSSIGCYLFGFNAEDIIFEGQQSGGGWDALITFTGTETFGTGLTYAIDGDTVYPAAGTGPGARVIEAGELIGGYVILTDSTGPSTTSHEILGNSAGTWRPDTTSQAVQIRIDSPPTITTPTVIVIVPPSMTGVAHGITTPYKAFRLRIPATQTTAEGYYKLGAFIAGPLLVFGQQYSWGRTSTIEAQVERVVLRDGVPTIRSLGPPRKSAEFAWSEGIYTAELYQSNPDPFYIVARDTGGFTGIALQDSATQLVGLLRRTNGAVPVVYLSKIDRATAIDTEFTYSAPSLHLYGWPGDVVTTQTSHGDENDSEMITINGITIEEAG